MIRARKGKSTLMFYIKVAKKIKTSKTTESEALSAEAQETQAEMSASASPQREATPSNPTPISTLPQKRALEDDYQPAVSSPLNPDFKPSKPQDEAALARERAPRAKKESLKKREPKEGLLHQIRAQELHQIQKQALHRSTRRMKPQHLCDISSHHPRRQILKLREDQFSSLLIQRRLQMAP
jgi:hypothetical protein